MGQAKDSSVGPGGADVLLSMHTIIKTHKHRQYTNTHGENTLHLQTFLTQDAHVDSHIRMIKLVMIGFAPWKSKWHWPSSIFVLSNNFGLT